MTHRDLQNRLLLLYYLKFDILLCVLFLSEVGVLEACTQLLVLTCEKAFAGIRHAVLGSSEMDSQRLTDSIIHVGYIKMYDFWP